METEAVQPIEGRPPGEEGLQHSGAACSKRARVSPPEDGQKPESLLRAVLSDFSSKDGLVVDICARHGGLAVAAQYECRKFIVIEQGYVTYNRGFAGFPRRKIRVFHTEAHTNTPIHTSRAPMSYL